MVVKLLWDEEHSDLAEALFDARQTRFAAPSLLAFEVGNVLRFTRALRTEEERQGFLSVFHGMKITLVPPDEELLDDALALACAKGVSFYDASYVALAKRLGTSFVTADRKLVRKLQDPSVVPLDADLPEDA